MAKLPEFKNGFSSFAHPSHPAHHQNLQTIPELNQIVDDTLKEIQATSLRQVADAVHERLPTFIYMDDYRSFCGTAQLDEVKRRKDGPGLNSADETLIQIMNMAGLDLDEEVKKGEEENREQRKLDMNDASVTLTKEIADRWSQKRYEVEFHADGQHFITFVKDADSKVLAPSVAGQARVASSPQGQSDIARA